MDDANAIDPDVIEIVIQLCTRVGMMMEDVSPLALDASGEGLEDRVAKLVSAGKAITKLAGAAETLLHQ